ncbi:hypothetical protein Droror1_Dr00028115 [Drosera rotundifolia]|jgi:hypothetical protein
MEFSPRTAELMTLLESRITNFYTNFQVDDIFFFLILILVFVSWILLMDRGSVAPSNLARGNRPLLGEASGRNNEDDDEERKKREKRSEKRFVDENRRFFLKRLKELADNDPNPANKAGKNKSVRQWSSAFHLFNPVGFNNLEIICDYSRQLESQGRESQFYQEIINLI